MPKSVLIARLKAWLKSFVTEQIPESFEDGQYFNSLPESAWFGYTVHHGAPDGGSETNGDGGDTIIAVGLHRWLGNISIIINRPGVRVEATRLVA